MSFLKIFRKRNNYLDIEFPKETRLPEISPLARKILDDLKVKNNDNWIVFERRTKSMKYFYEIWSFVGAGQPYKLQRTRDEVEVMQFYMNPINFIEQKLICEEMGAILHYRKNKLSKEQKASDTEKIKKLLSSTP